MPNEFGGSKRDFRAVGRDEVAIDRIRREAEELDRSDPAFPADPFDW